MDLKPNEQKREWLRVLRAYLTGLADGTRVSWVELEQQTGVPCSSRAVGRSLFRTACKRVGRRYEPLHGSGFEMSSAVTANSIVDRTIRKVAGDIARARGTTEIIAARHLDDLKGDDRRRIEHQRAALATIGLSAELARRELPPPNKT